MQNILQQELPLNLESVSQSGQRVSTEENQVTVEDEVIKRLTKYKRMTKRSPEESLVVSKNQSKKVKLSLDLLGDPEDNINDRENVREELGRMTKKYEDLVKKLRDKVECPVCFDIPKKAPVPVCPNGHVVCVRYYLQQSVILFIMK